MLLPDTKFTVSLILPVPLASLPDAPPEATLVQCTFVSRLGKLSVTTAFMAAAGPLLLATTV